MSRLQTMSGRDQRDGQAWTPFHPSRLRLAMRLGDVRRGQHEFSSAALIVNGKVELQTTDGYQAPIWSNKPSMNFA